MPHRDRPVLRMFFFNLRQAGDEVESRLENPDELFRLFFIDDPGKTVLHLASEDGGRHILEENAALLPPRLIGLKHVVVLIKRNDAVQ